MKNSQVLFTVGVTSLVLSVIFVIISFFLNKNIETVIIKEQTIPVEFSSPVKSNYFDFSAASEKATKAVVHIKSSLEKSKQENSRMEFNPFDFDPFGGGWGFFDMPRQPSSGMGSGVIISDKQTRGRGQHGKKWVSNKGNLFFSIFFMINKKIKTSTLVISNLRIIKKYCPII